MKLTNVIPEGKGTGNSLAKSKAKTPTPKKKKIVVSTSLPSEKKTTKKGGNKTMKERIVSAIRAGKSLSMQRKQGGFLTLKEIYKRTKVETTGDKAAIRGILNRDFTEDDQSEFVRNPKVRGSYKLRENSKAA